MRSLLVLAALVTSFALVGGTASRGAAQQPAGAQPRPEDVHAAAAAFGEGQRAQLQGDYARAADLFELADRSAPSAAALRSAIRNHRAAGQLARAATLALVATRRHPEDAETTALAREVIAAATPALARLRVRCAPECAVAVDGRAIGASAADEIEAFLDPGERALTASWAGRDPVRQVIALEAGGARELSLEAPPERAAEPERQVEPAPDPEEAAVPIDDAIARPAIDPGSAGGPARGERGGGGLSPVVLGVGAGLTAIALGAAIGVGVDTLAARDAYVADPTRARYEDGVVRQSVTTGLFVGAGALGIATLVIALFTDWGGEPAGGESARGVVGMPWVAADEHGAIVGWTQSLGGGGS